MDAGVPSRQVPLTLRQAAKREGMDVMSFKALADVNNGTSADLRLSGNRGAARYDPVRLGNWLCSRERPEKSPVTVQVRAIWEGAQWSASDIERSMSVAGPRLMAAQRSLADWLANVLRLGADQIFFDVVYEAVCPGMLAWGQAESLNVRADGLLNEAGRLRVEAILGLVGEGMTPAEIAEVFGVSYQRVQQILAGARDEGSENSDTGAGQRAPAQPARHR